MYKYVFELWDECPNISTYDIISKFLLQAHLYFIKKILFGFTVEEIIVS